MPCYPSLDSVVPILNFRGIDILKNDITAVLNQIFDLKFRTKRHFTMPPGPDYRIWADYVNSWAYEIQWFVNPRSEVISLRRSGLSKDTKRLPGKNLAVFIGVVISSLILTYNLTRDLSFILTSDKERIWNHFFASILPLIRSSKRFVWYLEMVLEIVSVYESPFSLYWLDFLDYL